MPPPDVSTYLDYRRFLRDWFDWKKAENPRYSHRLFARRAGVRSPSLLLLVADGRRNLTAQTTEAFCQAIGLQDDAARHFALLVRLDQAESSAERDEALEQILATKHFREARRLEAASFEYFAHWWFPALHELARRSDFRADPAWMAAALRPGISEEQAQAALKALLELGLLAPDEAGVPRPTDRSAVTAHEVENVAFNAYHRGMLERATEAVPRFEPQERHILGLTVAIPRDLVPRVKERLNEMQRELLALCDQAPPEQVFQLSMAFFPLSGSVDADEE